MAPAAADAPRGAPGAAAAAALGRPLTVLVNNASIFEYDRIDTATRQSWDRHIESNLRAPYVLDHRSLPAAGRYSERFLAALDHALAVKPEDRTALEAEPLFRSLDAVQDDLHRTTVLSLDAAPSPESLEAAMPLTDHLRELRSRDRR